MKRTPSEAYLNIIEAVNSPRISAQKIGEMIVAEPNLARTLVRVASSRQRGVGREVLEPERAVLLLGSTAVAHVALLHELIKLPNSEVHSTWLNSAFWEDTIRRGAACVLLAHRFGSVHPDIALACGMCLELGRMLILDENPSASAIFWETRVLKGEERLKAELEAHGVSHVEAFLEAVEDWSLPDEILKTVRVHHLSQKEIRDSEYPMLGFIARWADTIGELFSAEDFHTEFEEAKKILIKEAGFAESEVIEFLEQVLLQTMMIGDLLSVPIAPQEPVNKRLASSKSNASPETMSHTELLNYVETLLAERESLEEELQRLRKDVHSLTRFDPLTNLPSRGHYIPTLRQEVARARRYERPLSLILVDLDGFSEINAMYGQGAGDALLEKVAKVLSKVARDSDFIARTGGDEFALILPETDTMGGRVCAERVRAAVEAIRVGYDRHLVRSSASVAGLSLSDLHDNDADHEKLHAAGLAALKKLRERGPNRVVWVGA